MKAYKKMCIAVITIFLFLAAVLNIFLAAAKDNNQGIYRVEAKRLADEIARTGNYDLEKYPHITGVFTGGDLYRSDEHYLIIEAGGTLYRAEYMVESGQHGIGAVNCVLGALFLLVTGLLYYIRRHIIVPFGKLKDVPKELARGNLAVPIPEEKSRFFGKFTWGVNLLRESIEDSRKKEITMQRDKKLLLLSLSHDINYPLLIEHIIREAKLYREYVECLEKDGFLGNQSMKEVECFWNRIMMEHSMFIRGLLDPSENELFDSADKFADEYCRLLNKCQSAQNEALGTASLELTQKLRDFKTAGVQGIEQCQIRSIILPLLAGHVLREANHYIRLLKN